MIYYSSSIIELPHKHAIESKSFVLAATISSDNVNYSKRKFSNKRNDVWNLSGSNMSQNMRQMSLKNNNDITLYRFGKAPRLNLNKIKASRMTVLTE